MPYETDYRQPRQPRQPRRLLQTSTQRSAYAALALLLAALPFAASTFYVGEVTFIFIMCVARLGLMTLTGFTGQVSLGQALQANGARVVFVDTIEQLAKVRGCDAADFQLIRIVVLESQDGTTGAPRLVSIVHREPAARVRSGGDWMPLERGDHLLSFAPLSHIGERVTTLSALLARGALVHFPESSATVFNDLAEVAPHMIAAPPRFWKRLHDRVDLLMEEASPLAQRCYARALSGGRGRWWRRKVLRRVSASVGLQRVRMALIISGDIGPGAAAWYGSLGVPLYSAYCLNEAGGIACIRPINGDADVVNSGFELELAEDDEILIRGVDGGIAYWSTATSQPTRIDATGRLRTGDLGTLTRTGVRVLGRRSEHGAPLHRSVLPEQVEDALRSSSLFADALFIPEGDRAGRLVLALEEDRMRRCAQQMSLPFSDFARIVRCPEVQAHVAGEIDVLLRHLAVPITGFEVLSYPLRPGDTEWTPMLRMRRHAAFTAPLMADD